MKKVSMWVCAGVLAGAAPAFAQRMLDNADANKDGVITREEYQKSRLEMFDKLDRNDDGYIDSEDAPKFRRRNGGGGGERMEAMKAELDQDKDGRVSREEFANGPMLAFEKADTNRDGQLDQKEIEAFKELVKEAKEARAAKK
jgi:Ca2+-binding EF-hand superfamily protein